MLNIRTCIITAATTIAALCSTALSAAPTPWTKLDSGLDYKHFQPYPGEPGKSIYAFRIDPKNYQFKIISAKDFNLKSAYIFQLAKKANALIAINGGFFSPSWQPLGLRISDHKVLNPKKNISWWGVFQIKNDNPSVTSGKYFYPTKRVDFAIQAGPRLLINGAIPNLKPGLAERSALCVTRNKKVIIVITKHARISATDFAKLLLQPELNCYNALNLDGGSSSQLHASINDFSITIPSLRPVADAVAVIKK